VNLNEVKMSEITSLYIPRIDSHINAEFIADIFNRNGIAQVSRVYIEPHNTIQNSCYNCIDNYDCAYIAIKSWHDTEAAYNFIERLRSPSHEARLVYSNDDWWVVDINTKPDKLASNKRVLTIFEEKCDDLSINALACDGLDKFVCIDEKKTALLRNIVSNFKKQSDYNNAVSF